VGRKRCSRTRVIRLEHRSDHGGARGNNGRLLTRKAVPAFAAVSPIVAGAAPVSGPAGISHGRRKGFPVLDQRAFAEFYHDFVDLLP